MKSIANFFLLITTTLLALTACEAADPPGEKPSWNTLWTVDLAKKIGPGKNDFSDAITATLRAPRGAFWFAPAQPIDYKNFYARTSRVTMNWHFDSELPYYVWAKQLLPKHVNPSYNLKYKLPEHIKLSFTVSIANQKVKPGKAALSAYFEWKFNSSNPQLEPVDEGVVWSGDAHKYKLPYQGRMYKLLERKQYDPTVITCGLKVVYCRLRGGQYNASLLMNGITIPHDDLSNWRIYFKKAKKLLKQSLIEPHAGVQQ